MFILINAYDLKERSSNLKNISSNYDYLLKTIFFWYFTFWSTITLKLFTADILGTSLLFTSVALYRNITPRDLCLTFEWATRNLRNISDYLHESLWGEQLLRTKFLQSKVKGHSNPPICNPNINSIFYLLGSIKSSFYFFNGPI